ncbi:MAG: UDP-N-acetylmuramate dehydrogenase [Clostridia bacterium]
MNLEDVIDKSKIKYDEDLSKHCTMGVGGKADIMVLPTTENDIINTVKYARDNDINLYILGCGSNVVISDKGIRGIVLKIAYNFKGIEIKDDYVTALAGTSMPIIAIKSRDNNLSGFEFACGIPGTIGGGVKMNAGAYDSEMSNVIVSVKYLDENYNICEIKKEDMDMSYRHTIFLDNNKYIILSVKLKLEKKDKEYIINKMNENTLSRKTKQPLEYNSAGSVFRRPKGYFVGKLITDSNLKGVNVGGAYVSEKHARIYCK